MDTKEDSQRTELKERIIITALSAFKKKGIKSITMDEVASLLKISKRTLYEVFEDKETLLRECVIYHQCHSKKMIENILANSTNVLEIILKCYQKSVEMLRDTDIRFVDELKKYPGAHEIMVKCRKQDNDVVTDFLKKGVTQGLFRNDINYEIIQLLLRKQLDILKNTEICSQYSFLEVYEAIILTYLRGISTQKGADELETFVAGYRKTRMMQNNVEIREDDA
ncbi:HTH-type transcriptional repressor KstR2 [termite gut metagenome]|uniref:HTH-type transcriptional repressor KstR2 n=1 Tax=termite gut metagenome TaxID=433724 RepID=A0A5J4RGW8_9ZZZZ